MAIKRSPIISTWKVNIYCDKCGEIMKFRRTEYPTNSNELNFVYACTCKRRCQKNYTITKQFSLILARWR